MMMRMTRKVNQVQLFNKRKNKNLNKRKKALKRVQRITKKIMNHRSK